MLWRAVSILSWPGGGYDRAGRPAPDPTVPAARIAWSGVDARTGARRAAEIPVALTYNRTTHAVMLASPGDLHDFAFGFSLSEGIIDRRDILALDIVEVTDGMECRMDLAIDRLEALTKRQRRLAGPQWLRPVRPGQSGGSGSSRAPRGVRSPHSRQPMIQCDGAAPPCQRRKR